LVGLNPPSVSASSRCFVLRTKAAPRRFHRQAQRQRLTASQLRSYVSEARTFLAGVDEDPELWESLVWNPEVKDFIKRSLLSGVEEDPGLVRSIIAHKACNHEFGLQEASAGPRQQQDPATTLAEELQRQSSRHASGRNFFATLATNEAFCASVLDTFLPSAAGAGSRHGLDSTSGAPTEEEPTLLKRRRIRRSKGSAASQSSTVTAPTRRSVLAALTSELTGLLMSYLDIRTKVAGCLRVSRDLRQAMQTKASWDPLSLGQPVGRSFLRVLKRSDPLGCFAADVNKTKRLFPKGLFEASWLEVVLMDPERTEIAESDTEDETPRPRPLIITDPLDEVCKRLRHYFSSVVKLTITNIEDYRMDYRFVGLRAGNLANFGYVELMHHATNPPTYSLAALKDEPPRRIDVEAARADNRSRLPPDVLFDDTTCVSEREALFLAEHRSAYKNGSDFHLAHAFYRTVKSHGVRKRYKAVLASLRKRFPDRFSLSDEQGSPDADAAREILVQRPQE